MAKPGLSGAGLGYITGCSFALTQAGHGSPGLPAAAVAHAVLLGDPRSFGDALRTASQDLSPCAAALTPALQRTDALVPGDARIACCALHAPITG